MFRVFNYQSSALSNLCPFCLEYVFVLIFINIKDSLRETKAFEGKTMLNEKFRTDYF